MGCVARVDYAGRPLGASPCAAEPDAVVLPVVSGVEPEVVDGRHLVGG